MRRVGLIAPLTSPDVLLRLPALSVARQLRARLEAHDELVLIHPEPQRCDTVGVRVDDVAGTLDDADVDACLHMGIDQLLVDTPVPTLVYSQRNEEVVIALDRPGDVDRVQVVLDPRFTAAAARLTKPRPDRKLGGVVRMVVRDVHAVARRRAPMGAAYHWLLEVGEQVELIPVHASAFGTLQDHARGVDPHAVVVRSRFALRWLADLQASDLVVCDDPRLAGLTLAAPVPVVHLDDGADVPALLGGALRDLDGMVKLRRRQRDRVRRSRPVTGAHRQLDDALTWLLDR